MSKLRYTIPSPDKVHKTVQDTFKVKPCQFQVKAALQQLERKDCITITSTGSEKTLTFWIPLLFNAGGITIIITALTVLGESNAKELKSRKIEAINLTGEFMSEATFKDIEKGKYRVIITSPEKIIKDPDFRRLWQSSKFVSRLFNITIDEGHCISQWSDGFRPEYALLAQIRWEIPSHIPFYVVSTTMPTLVLRDVMDKLWMRGDSTTIIHRSNDRPNIHMIVEKMQHTIKSMANIDQVLCLDKTGTKPPPKFMVFVNRRLESEGLAEYLRNQLPLDHRHKIVWFPSGMSQTFRQRSLDQLQAGEIWEIVCTDAAGMGIDQRDVLLIVQWRYTTSLSTLAQQLGRGAQDQTLAADFVYLAESKYFDSAKKKASFKPKRTGKRKHGVPKDTFVKQSRIKLDVDVVEAVEDVAQGLLGVLDGHRHDECGDDTNGEDDAESDNREDENTDKDEDETDEEKDELLRLTDSTSPVNTSPMPLVLSGVGVKSQSNPCFSSLSFSQITH